MNYVSIDFDLYFKGVDVIDWDQFIINRWH